MSNPNIFYKEISELLKELDLEINKIKDGNDKEKLSLLSIDLSGNKFGINSDNIGSIVSTFKKYGIIKYDLHKKADCRHFLKTDINSNIISEIKNLHGFDFKSYVDKIEEASSTAKSSKYAAWASVVIAIVSALTSIYQCRSNDNTFDNLTERYNQAKQSIDSLSKVQTKTQLRTLGLEDSLKSLKSKIPN